jgi:DNA-binding response OmpR family regulator
MADEVKSVLIVDENSTLTEMVGDALTRAGFDVASAQDGREAWDLAESSTFDLAVVEFGVLGPTGSPLCHTIREAKKYKNTSVMVTIAASEKAAAAVAKDELRLAQVFLKPLSVKKLVAAIEQCLSGEAPPADEPEPATEEAPAAVTEEAPVAEPAPVEEPAASEAAEAPLAAEAPAADPPADPPPSA